MLAPALREQQKASSVASLVLALYAATDLEPAHHPAVVAPYWAAMPGEKMKIVEEGWRAINRGDVDALLDFVTDDLVFRPPSHRLDGITFRGHAGVRAWMERQTESWSKMQGSPHELVTVGEHLVTALDVQLIGHESGVPVNQRVFTVYTFREGKIAAIIAYPGERDALEAVGLSGHDARADST